VVSRLCPPGRRTLAFTVFCAALAAGCARSDEPSDDAAGSGSTTSATTESTPTESTTTSDDLASSESPSSSGVPWDCDPVVPGSYERCPENTAGVCVGGTCLEAFAVEGGRVCSLIGCVDRCDCYAPPATGTATVECMENVVADGTACILHCGNGEQCPDGMECSVQTCVWPPA
jgi:hypothetical protein